MGFQPSAGEENECDNCGAHLPPFGPDGTRTCSFCSRVYQKPTAPAASAPFGAPGPGIVISPTVPNIDWTQASRTAKRAGGGCGLVSIVVVVAIIGAVVFAVTRFSDSISSAVRSATSNTNLTGPVLLLPGEPNRPVSSVVLTQGYDSGARSTVYAMEKIDGATGTSVWRTPLPDAFTYSPILTNGSMYFTVVKAQVVAVRDADGSVAWQRTLSDEVQVTSCTTCFAVSGDRLIAQSSDGNLQVLDTTTGAPAWQRTLVDTQAQVVPFGDRVLLSDGKSSEAHLSVLALADGTEQSVLSPTCPRQTSGSPEDYEVGAIIQPLVEENAVVLGFGFGYACWQRLDLASGAPSWVTPASDSTLGRTYADVVPGDGNRLLVVDSGKVSIVDMGSGALTDLGGESGEQRDPIALTGDSVVLRERSSRGTTKYSVAAYDAATGTQRWTADLGTASPADPPDANTSSVTANEARFVVSVQGDTVRLVTFRGGSNDFMVQNVSLATGVAPGSPTVSAGLKSGVTSPQFRPAGWRGPSVVLVIEDQLVTLDTATATVTQRWPS
jgi:outer membrane protein assembly factor BamB